MEEKRNVFVLHIWQEGRQASPARKKTIRGSIQQANSDEIRYFQTTSGLMRVLTEWIGWPSPED